MKTTDGQLVALARRIDAKAREFNALVDSVLECDHPNAEAFVEAMVYEEQMKVLASATHIVTRYLCEPSKWQVGESGIRYNRSGIR